MSKSSLQELEDISASEKLAELGLAQEPSNGKDEVNEKKLIRKIDMRLIPWFSLLYLLNSMDRGSIGNAKLYNLAQDIHVTDRQYLIAITVAFFPYTLLQSVTNLMMKKTTPSIFLSTSVLLWGIATTFHGFVRNYAGLIVVRLFLGIFEAGLYPGVILLLSCWYTRAEIGLRISIFVSAATVAGAFSGLLAAAIESMDGIGGKHGWSWIFVLEGIFTFVCAVASYWIIPDFPHQAKFINKAECAFIIERLRRDQQFSAGGEEFKRKNIIKGLKDWSTWIAMAMFVGFDPPLFAFSVFTPSVINELGFQATTANLLSVPPYAWACILTCVVGFIADRHGHRGMINIIFYTIGILGYILLIVSTNSALSYFAVYLAASAIYPVIANSAAMVSVNVEGAYKRSLALGMAIGFGNLNNAVTSNAYRARDAPRYRLGHGIVLMYLAIGWLASVAYFTMLRLENARRDRGERDEVIEGVDNDRANEKNGIYHSVDEAKDDKGDAWSGFRYSI